MASASFIHSMTGFGRAAGHCEGWDLTVELRSVNHRYCDIRLRLPVEFQPQEVALRKQVQGMLGRGRVDITVLLEREGGGGNMPQLQADVAARYIALHKEVAALTGSPDVPMDPTVLLQLPGVVSHRQDEAPIEALVVVLQETVTDAVARLCEMRRREGEELTSHLLEMLAAFASCMETIETRAPAIPTEQFKRLQERLTQFSLENEIEKGRLQQEIALFADRCDVSEELARLHSHIQQFKATLSDGGVVGRRLDFLCQELLRETNTIGSKNVDPEIGTELISMKATIEKIREQVQNVE